jgi:hypothetical protein
MIDKEQLFKAFKEAEMKGYDRGIKTIFLKIFQAMEEDKMLFISYKSLKELYEAIISEDKEN